MIRSQRELNVTLKRISEFEAAIERFDLNRPPPGVQPEGHRAAYDALVGFRMELHREIEQYEQLLTYGMAAVHVGTLAEVPTALIQARIAQRLSQAGLAARLGVKPQQVQRWESEHYENAAFASILDVANALELTDGFRATAAAEAQSAIVATEPGVSWWQLGVIPGIAEVSNPAATGIINSVLSRSTNLPPSSRNNYVIAIDQNAWANRHYVQHKVAQTLPAFGAGREMLHPLWPAASTFAVPSHVWPAGGTPADLAVQVAELKAEVARMKAELERHRPTPAAPIVPQDQNSWLARFTTAGGQDIGNPPAFGELVQ